MADLSSAKNAAPTGRLLVVGLGLIGGSLALAARQRHLFREVIGQEWQFIYHGLFGLYL